MTVLYRRFLEREGAEDHRGDFYRSYVRRMKDAPHEVEAFLATAIAELDDIPQPRKSHLAFDYEVDPNATPPARVTIVHDDDEGFGTLAHYAATIGSVLYRSNLRWTSITSGREIDIVGGTTVRFVPASEAPQSSRGPVHTLDDLPDDEDELIKLFGGRRRVTEVAAPRLGWREKLAAQRPGSLIRSEPPPRPGGVSSDSQDSGDGIDVEVDDSAATLVAGMETDDSASPQAARSSSPAIASSPAVVPAPAAVAFDPRRSSPVGGVPLPSRFDARRSSPVGGQPAVTSAMVAAVTGAGSAAPFDPRRSSPMTGMASLSSTSPPRAVPRPVSEPAPPPASPGAASPALVPSYPPLGELSPSSAVTHLERSHAPARSRGRWIIVSVAFVAVAVIVIVSIFTGMSLGGPAPAGEGEESGSTTSIPTVAPASSPTTSQATTVLSQPLP
ncbi:MAG: hypothetical protein R3B70_11580 [Polyangiaceae bacterium]